MKTEDNKLFSTRTTAALIKQIKDHSQKTGKKIYAIFEEMVIKYFKEKK